ADRGLRVNLSPAIIEIAINDFSKGAVATARDDARDAAGQRGARCFHRFAGAGGDVLTNCQTCCLQGGPRRAPCLERRAAARNRVDDEQGLRQKSIPPKVLLIDSSLMMNRVSVKSLT